jgi:hypothetical protein
MMIQSIAEKAKKFFIGIVIIFSMVIFAFIQTLVKAVKSAYSVVS